MFDIVKTLSFNKEKLVAGNEYDYVTRTSLNQGILQETGFVNKEKLNEAHVWSLGLLQMDFFYRKRKWYAGQFVRKIIPKFNVTEKIAPFISVVLNRLKPVLLRVLVRDVDKVFKNQMIFLPVKNNQIDFDFMEKFVSELEAERLEELEAYLIATGLNDYRLSNKDKDLLTYQPKFASFTLASSYVMRKKLVEVDDKGLFNIVPTKKKINANSVNFGGRYPYVARGEKDNGIRGDIDFDKEYLNTGNTISFGQDTATMYYQPNPYFTGDKIQIFNLNERYGDLDENIAIYLITALNKTFANYTWGQQSFALETIASLSVELPVTDDGNIDFEYMRSYVNVVKKISIEDVVKYKDNVISLTKKVVS